MPSYSEMEKKWTPLPYFFNGRLFSFHEIPSSNTYLLHHKENHLSHDVIWVKNQTHGRAQQGRKWISQEGSSLTFSILVDIQYQGHISLLTGLALCRYLKKNYFLFPWMKWPNDLLLNQKKVGGILCEVIDTSIIVGIGLNVSNSQENLKHVTDQPTISLKDALGQCTPPLEKILTDILTHLKEVLIQYSSSSFSSFLQEWRTYFPFEGKEIILRRFGKKEVVKVNKLLKSGALEVTLSTGVIEQISSGELLIS